MAGSTPRTSTAEHRPIMRSSELGLTAMRSQRAIRWRARAEPATLWSYHSIDAPVPHPCSASWLNAANMAAEVRPQG